MFEEAKRRLDLLCDDVTEAVVLPRDSAVLLLKHLYTQLVTFGGHLRVGLMQMLPQKVGPGKTFETPDDVTDEYLSRVSKLFERLANNAKHKTKAGQLPLPMEKLRFMILEAEYQRVKTLLVTAFGEKVLRFVPWKQTSTVENTEDAAEDVTQEGQEDAKDDTRPSAELAAPPAD